MEHKNCLVADLVDGSMNSKFWRGKRVFITGHTGFKGSWTVLWLKRLGAIVKGFALEPVTNPSLFELASLRDNIESEIGDIRDLDSLKRSISNFKILFFF